MVADAAPRVSNVPTPGAVRNLPTLNADQEVHGVVFMNNLLIDNLNGGIRVSGDGAANAPDVFARLVNNTIFGGGDGILIDQGAAPTLLNNAIVNTTTAIRGNNAGTVVIAEHCFANNGTQIAGLPGVVDPFVINASNQVFQDPSAAVRNFYPYVDKANPALSSELIDSSIVSRDER